MKKYFDRFYFKVFIFLFTAFVLFFAFFYGDNDLFRLPFNAEVWGTFSDWMMISVTLGTAYWLVKTFREQKRANDISENKDRREVMPRFDIKEQPLDYYEETVLPLPLVLRNNIATKIEVTFVQDISHGETKTDYLEEAKHIIVFVDMEALALEGSDIPVAFIHFSDIDGRNYYQSLWWEGRYFTMSWPTLELRPGDTDVFQDLEFYINSFFTRWRKKKPNPPF